MRRYFLLLVIIIAGSIYSSAGVTDEGIVVGPFIFKPNFSLVFEHTDNLYLQGVEGFHDNLWILRPQFQLVYPFQESNVEITYVPIWRKYEHYHLKHKFSHFLTLQSNIVQSSGLNIKLGDRYVRGMMEVGEIDPAKEVWWGTNRFNKNLFEAGATYDVSERFGVNFRGSYNYLKFIDHDTPQFFFDYKTLGVGGSFAYKTSPLTSIFVSYNFIDNSAEKAYDDRNFKSHQLLVGMQSDATPRLKGGFQFGYERKNLNNQNLSINNFILSADMSYEITESTRLMVNANRGTYQSAYFNAAYFRATGAAITLTHQFTAKLSASGGGLIQRNDYQDTGAATRKDSVYGFNAEIGYIINTLAVVHFNYKYDKRDSNAGRQSFTQNRLDFDVLLGW